MHEGMLMLCMTQMPFTDTRARKIIFSYLQHLAAWCPMYAFKKVIRTFQLPVRKLRDQMQRMRDDAI